MDKEIASLDDSSVYAYGSRRAGRSYFPAWTVALLAGVVLVSSSGGIGYSLGKKAMLADDDQLIAVDENLVLPPQVVIPVQWGDRGYQLVEAGVINREQFLALYRERGGADAAGQLLERGDEDALVITPHNAPVFLNLLWAFGLANQNEILEQGPMQDERYGGAGGFASTGGWTLATGDAMDHYSRHPFVMLTSEQQARVARVAMGIYRPCCDNPTHFPDCNHGMAMLGLLELMAAQNLSEQDMYRYALQVNAYWFPETYLTIAAYFAKEGVAWEDVDPQEVLGYDFSSATGYRNVLAQVEPATGRSGGSCGV
jgi:hypothetical protein